MIKKSIGFCLGMLVTAIPLVWVIVYVFHDVDAKQTGKLDLAFRQLTDEALFFILLTSTVFVTVSLLRRFKSSPAGRGEKPNHQLLVGCRSDNIPVPPVVCREESLPITAIVQRRSLGNAFN
jgi:hypothetical protein